jgi:hypothetical protein
MRRSTTVEELEAETPSEPGSGDGGEATEEQLPDGIEPETEAEEEQVEMQDNQSQLSRSQKRRRHRR